MMTAEAFASIDIAWILAFIFLRSRSTRDRLPSASERLPPALCWIDDHDAEEVRLRQRHALEQLGAGLAQRDADRSASRRWPGIRSCTGSGASVAMMRRQSPSGRPALTPRTMTSTASGKLMQELVLAPLLQKAEQPARHAEAAGKGRRRLRPACRRRRGRPATNSTTPIADADDDELPLRPAQAGLRDAHRQAAGSSAFFCRTSSSFSVSSTCSRRTFGLVARRRPHARAAGSGRDDAFLAPLGLALARQDRIDEHPDHAAGGERDQDEHGKRLHRHGGLLSSCSGSPATSAASSAAASRFSSPK